MAPTSLGAHGGLHGGTTAGVDPHTRSVHLVDRRPAARRLQGDYKQSAYGRVILPFTVLRRLDCVLEPTKDAVLQRAAALAGRVQNVDPILRQVAGEQFHNTSPLTMQRVLDNPNNVADNLLACTRAFSSGAREVLEKFDLPGQVERLRKADLLCLGLSRFCDIDLHPDAVSNLEMGYLYEELIRRFSELSNEAAGEHFTSADGRPSLHRRRPRADQARRGQDAAGPGLRYRRHAQRGGESPALAEPGARLQVYGQELNPETYAVCART